MEKLEENVRTWVEDRAEDYDNGARGVVSDLFEGGCQSGIVSHLIYYTDTVKFYEDHQREIDALLQELCQDCGCSPAELFGDKWEKDDPLAREDLNKNLLAWFGFEETARRLYPDY